MTSIRGRIAGRGRESSRRIPVRPAPERIRLVRRQAQPVAAYVARLTITAVVAYLVAKLTHVNKAPTLAPLTSLLVLQVSLFQTIRSAVRRISAVLAGVLIALALAATVGFTWWTLGLSIAVALTLGHMLRLGDHLLEAPISAMLILSVGGGEFAGVDRVGETLIGAAIGLLAGLVVSPARVQSAGEAIDDLCDRSAALLRRMADGLESGPDTDTVADWPPRARDLAQEIGVVDQALDEAEESTRLNPRAMLTDVDLPLRGGLEILEHMVLTIRGMARSLADHTHDGLTFPEGARERLQDTLRALADVIGRYGRLARLPPTSDSRAAEDDLRHAINRARRRRRELGETLHVVPPGSVRWRLYGELLVHLDRVINSLRAERRDRARDRRLRVAARARTLRALLEAEPTPPKPERSRAVRLLRRLLRQPTAPRR